MWRKTGRARGVLAHKSLSQSIKCTIEELEGRRLLAAVSWDGGGDGVNWATPANWSNDAVPGALDDVTISIAANPTIILAGTRVVKSLILNETLTVQGSLQVIDPATVQGTLQVSGGTIQGGVYNISGGTFAATAAGGTLNNVTINGDLSLPVTSAHMLLNGTSSFTNARLSAGSTSIGFAPGSTINGTIVFEGAEAGTRHVEMNGTAGILTLGPTGAIRTAPGFGGAANIGGTFWSGGSMTLVNNGTISSETSGRTITVAPAVFTNNGTAQATNGGILSVTSANWTNPGSINVNAGTLNLGGTFASTAGIGTFSNTGGTVNVTGTINNIGNAITLNNSTGSWNLLAGSISGGAVNYADGKTLVITTAGGTLSNVAIGGDLPLAVPNAKVVISGNTSFGIAHLSVPDTSIAFAPGATLNGTILFEGAAAGTRYVEMNGNPGTLTIAPASAIRTAPGFGGTGNIGGTWWYGGPMTLINDGTISAETSGRAINLVAASFTNNGAARSSNGGTLNITSAAWSNPGTITTDASTVNLGGTMNATGGIGGFGNNGTGIVNVTGTINNAGSTIGLNDGTGSWNLLGGSISGGTVNYANGKTLVMTTTGGTLNNVVINGDLPLGVVNAKVVISGNTSFGIAHLSQPDTSIAIAPGTTINGTIQFEGATGNRHVEMNGTSGTATLGAGSAIKTVAGFGGTATIGGTWWYGGGMTLINNGTISSQAAGRTINIVAAGFTNNGTAEATGGGNLNITSTAWSNPGTINANASTVNLGGTMNATAGIGTFSNAAGTVNVTGTINNAGNTITVNNSTGSWNLVGGSFSGGSVNYADGKTIVITPTGGTLNNVAINGDLPLAVANAKVVIGGNTSFGTAHLSEPDTSVGFAPGATLNGTISFEGAAGGSRYVEMNGTSGTLTVAPTSVIQTAAGFGGTGRIGGVWWYGGSMTLINNGTISSETSGRTINLLPSEFTNNGTAQALNGGTLNITSANWTNPGTMNVDGSTVNFGGTMNTTGGAGTISNTAGTVNITGTLSNAGNTIILNDTTGSWNLLGGAINGGVVSIGTGRRLEITPSGGSLNSVLISGDLFLDVPNARVVISGTTSYSVAHMIAANTSLGYAPGTTLVNWIQFEGPDPGSRYVEMNGTSGTFTIGNSSQIRTTPDFGGTGIIGGNWWYGGTMTLNNPGTILSQTSGRAINVVAANFTNFGVLEAKNGGILNITSNDWRNPGVTRLTSSTINLGGNLNATQGTGPFDNDAGTVNITGTLNYTGATMPLNNSYGSWNLLGGTVTGGTVEITDGKSLVMTPSGGNLNNVTINGDLTFPLTNSRVAINGTTSFTVAHMTGGSSSIAFPNGATLTGTIQMEGPDPAARYVEMHGPTGTLTIGPSGAITTVPGFGGSGMVGANFWFGGIPTLINNGTISAGASGRNLTLNSPTFTNTGIAEAKNGGTLVLRSANDGGILTGGTWRLASAGSLVVQPVSVDATTALRDAVRALIKSGRNGGTWDGPGISGQGLTSNQAIGVILNTSTAPDSILVRHTLVGDLNLDRTVSIADFLGLSAKFGLAGGWWDGDVNYDDTVTIADFLALASNFGQSLPIPAGLVATAAAASGVDEKTAVLGTQEVVAKKVTPVAVKKVAAPAKQGRNRVASHHRAQSRAASPVLARRK
jgi:hypothetical protein